MRKNISNFFKTVNYKYIICILILVIICLIIMYILMKKTPFFNKDLSKSYIAENNTKKIINYSGITFNLIDKHVLNNIKTYLNYVGDHEIYFKTGMHLQKDELLQFYLNSVIDFTNTEIMTLVKSVKYIKDKFNTLPELSGEWNFIKINSRLEQGNAFTIGTSIFLPENIIINIKINTLIHEKIHINQRLNSGKYAKYYINQLKYTYLEFLHISDFWKLQRLTNPDGLDIKWGYKYENKMYLPMVIFKNNSNTYTPIIIELKK